MLRCPSALLAIPVHPKHCVFVCVCSETSGVPLASIKVLAMEQAVRDWAPTVPLPFPITRLCVWFLSMATRHCFLVGQKPPPLAQQPPYSPSAHSYPPIRQLSSVKTQQPHSAMLYNSGSSHTHMHTHKHCGVSTASNRPTPHSFSEHTVMSFSSAAVRLQHKQWFFQSGCFYLFRQC